MADPIAQGQTERAKGWVGSVILLALAGLVLWFVITVMVSEEQPIVHEQMTVIGFGMGASYAGNSAIIRVRDTEGLEHQVPAPSNIGESCSEGDTIAIQRQGLKMQIGVEACSPGGEKS